MTGQKPLSSRQSPCAPEPLPTRPEGEKLQKVLARAGCGSRREMERVIEQGRVRVNGRPAKPGDRVGLTDRIELDRKLLRLNIKEQQNTRIILYNKPEGEICSRSDPEGRRTVFEALPRPKSGRWISVGRLDFNTSGLLLFTTNGELANALMHPSSVVDREYLVRVQGQVDEDMKTRLLEGVLLEDGVARFSDLVDGSDAESGGRNRWFYCVVMEGKNREVRRLWESQGVRVSRLKRVRFGNIFIPSHVRAGQWIELDNREIQDLCLTVGIEPPKNGTTPDPGRKAARERHQRKLRAGKTRRR